MHRPSQYKPFPHTFIFSVHSQKPCCDGRGAKKQVVVTTGSCSLKPAGRRPGCVNCSFSDRMTEEIRCSTGRLSSPFQGSTAHPHMREGAIKGALKKPHPETKTGQSAAAGDFALKSGKNQQNGRIFFGSWNVRTLLERDARDDRIALTTIPIIMIIVIITTIKQKQPSTSSSSSSSSS